MTDVLDIYRAANILVEEYGPEQAALMAANVSDRPWTLEELVDQTSK